MQDSVYLFDVTRYRDNVRGKVRQRSEYIVKEVIR